ncbi:cytochrome-c peroxidase [Flammeovirga aprica]|uniref:Methylamine utilization protein n=1 Tax=Flammeovirga aprica JL-4 TaxID=694437 RepID=A0A7X9P0N5_9BACT|nr:cytochrome c peroxidase [Flammeovirga aprica]NME67389.1 methylamine utilization protein [Flammeovirga aprica JL-4]
MKIIIVLALITISICSCKSSIDNEQVIQQQKEQLIHYYQENLNNCLTSLKTLRKQDQTEQLKKEFDQARISFKSIEPIMAFYASNSYKSLNQPNLPQVEEFDNADKVIQATGFQVIEELLYASDSIEIDEIHRQTDLMINTLNLELNNNKILALKPHHLLWMVRNELVRITALGISGFDSPVYLNSIAENKYAYNGIAFLLSISKDYFKDQQLLEEWNKSIVYAQNKLSSAESFDQFDRFTFIKESVHPMLELWVRTAKDWEVEFPFEQKINYNAVSLFDQNTFNINKFSSRYSLDYNEEVVALGKQLFHDEQLSHNGIMSCATCHDPQKAFTDGLPKSITNTGTSNKRNAPTLMYAGLQAAQFYDSRKSLLENQIMAVVKNKDEFHSDMEKVVSVVEENKEYTQQLEKHYKKTDSQSIRNAIAMYVRSLSPFNSKFDQGITSDQVTLSVSEINGFNLFMGKAKCGTCHFAPIFNGTVPPLFNHSELEVLGVPSKKVWENAEVDEDKGRYEVSKAPLKMFAFKTPTIRNISKTAPYMHNGVFETLDEVLKFYNQGGGEGIGIHLENQTLPTDQLNLTENELSDLVAFMESLTDEVSY